MIASAYENLQALMQVTFERNARADKLPIIKDSRKLREQKVRMLAVLSKID
jgi:hypothetical protein